MRLPILLFTFFLLTALPLGQKPVAVTAQDDLPLTWRREYFPEFRLEIAETDLNRLLTVPVDKDNTDLTKYAITLHYQGAALKGTIRLRGGNASRCGGKRQFRIDFPQKVALPDGYRTDRFETDHGICNTLNEWLGWQLIDEAAARRPELTLPRKHSNVVALYFNDRLYHVQTLLEDVNKDLTERYLGTRNTVAFKGGCYDLPKEAQSEITGLCRTGDAAQLEQLLDAPAYLYVNALVQMLGSADMYPAYPWNWYLIFNQQTGRTHFLAHDLDMAIDYVSGVEHDPFTVVCNENWAQQQYQALLANAKWGAVYRQYVEELTALVEPEFFVPLAAAKYEQVRETLLACPDLPFGAEYYDAQYRRQMPVWSAARAAYLRGLRDGAPRPRLSFFSTTLGSDGEAYALVTAELNNDEHPDLAIANLDNGSVTLIYGLKGDGHWWGVEAKTIQVGGKPLALAALDVDGDGWDELAVADYTGDEVALWRNQRDGTFAKQASFNVPKALSLNVVKDESGATLLLAVADGANGAGNLRRARLSQGALEELPPLNAGAWAQPPAFGDLDGDGKLDAALANAADNQLTLLFGVTGAETRVATVATPSACGAIVVADFDRDGSADIAALASDANQLLRWRNQGGGAMQLDNVVELPTGFWRGDYRSMAAADFDGDRWPDVVITDYREGIVRIFRGAPAGFANARSEWTGSGNKSHGVIAPDLNLDGKPDIVAVAGQQGWVAIHVNHGGFTSGSTP